jgi:hypothetical protein
MRKVLAGLAETVVNTVASIPGSMSKLFSLKILLFIALGVFMLHLFDVITLPFPPFTTKGKIYVDSPEVYTRERLVNDRYDQDYWLRKQLKKLDELDIPLVSEKRETTVTVKAQAGKPAAAEDSSGSDGSSGQAQMTFNQKFRVVAGIRDMIRQQILENMLDDRHDLSGNSVFGLKFDTTVIPGVNTHNRAFVHVKLQVDDLFSSKNGTSKGLPDHISGYVASKTGAIDQSQAEADRISLVRKYEKQLGHYRTWLRDISERLNRMEDSVFESMKVPCPQESQADDYQKKGRDFYDKLTRSTLEIVLGVPQELFTFFNPRLDDELPPWMALPPPWANFFQIYRRDLQIRGEDKDVDTCNFRVWFEAKELDEQLIAIQRPVTLPYLCESEPVEDSVQANSTMIATPKNEMLDSPSRQADDDTVVAEVCAKGEKQLYLVPVGDVEEGAWVLYIQPWNEEERRLKFGEGDTHGPKYELSSQIIEALRIVKDSSCEQVNADTELCQGWNRHEIYVPAGFFNFVEHLSALDAYSYAIFPKNDVVGVLAETSSQLTGAASGAGFLGIGTRLSESRTASVLVGYGDARGSDPAGDGGDEGNGNSIAFGWVISARGDMEPTQKSQLALVSVPAWTDKLKLKVYVGWLDREGAPLWSDEQGPFDIEIAVPPDFEAFDSIFRKDAWVMREPRIQEEARDQDICVKAGEKVRILIPGSRLWRSTSVTLGAQLAERIRVLPNMEGIIAEFGPVDLPHAAYNKEPCAGAGESPETCFQDICKPMGKLNSRPVTLRVWTSEGMAKADYPVCVFYDRAKVIGIPEGGAIWVTPGAAEPID